MKKTEVMFRNLDGTIIAMIPYEIASMNPQECLCYTMEYHGPMDTLNVVKDSVPAKEDEYRELKQLLEEEEGYNVKVRRRGSTKMFNARLELVKELSRHDEE